MKSRIGILLVAALLVAGCGGAPRTTSYEPVPDKTLYQEIRALPGVRTAQVRYRNDLDNYNTYAGEIRVGGQVDPRKVLDQVIAILRQGPKDATFSVSVYPPGKDALGVDASSLGVDGIKDLDRRYGKQPGDGKPPDTLPSPTG